MTDEGDVGSQAGDPLVHVFERLKIWDVHHHEKGLLEWITDSFGLLENLIKELLDLLWDFQRFIDGSAYADKTSAHMSPGSRVG
ncbi:hypothetical protein ES703_121870 [subsurface metagenome]